jgi:hypothetical protein
MLWEKPVVLLKLPVSEMIAKYSFNYEETVNLPFHFVFLVKFVIRVIFQIQTEECITLNTISTSFDK